MTAGQLSTTGASSLVEIPDESETLVCQSCMIAIDSEELRSGHYRSQWHRYNVKRKCQDMPPLTQQVFDEKVAEILSAENPEKPAPGSFECQLCKKAYNSDAALQQHFKTKKHVKLSAQARKSKQASRMAGVTDDATTDLDKPQQTSTSSEKSTTSAAAESSPKAIDADNSATQIEGAMQIEGDGEIKSEELSEADLLARLAEDEDPPVPLGDCLFCSEHFNKVETALNHMLKIHGFFIPFVDNLVSVEELLLYLGAKIGTFHECLSCSRKASFVSIHAVRQHMTMKNHCKLDFEADDEYEEELDDFYDFSESFSSEKEDSKMSTAADEKNSETQLIEQPKSRRFESISAANEMVLTDGSIIGTRELRRYYKQKYRPSEQRDNVLIAKMSSSYRMLTLPGYHNTMSPQAQQDTKRALQRAQKWRMRLGVKANKLQTHFRAQVEF